LSRCWQSGECGFDASDAADAWCDGSGNPGAPSCCITDERERELLQIQYNTTKLHKAKQYSKAMSEMEKFIFKEGELGRADLMTANLSKCIKKISDSR